MSSTKLVTQESLIGLVEKYPEKAIGRALVAIFNNQRSDEQHTNDVRYNNGIGFTPADAHTGSITAKYYLKHGNLLDWQIERWTRKNSKGIPRIAKYWKQLNEVAIKKSAKI